MFGWLNKGQLQSRRQLGKGENFKIIQRWSEGILLSIDQQAMLEVMKSSLFVCPIKIIEEADYRFVFKELCAHTMIGPTVDILEELPLDDALRKEWVHAAMRSIYLNNCVASVQNAALKIFMQNDISCIVLKGLAAAMYYPRPELRELGDIDLLVPIEEFDNATDCLLKAGGFISDYDESNPRHISIVYRNVRIELHQYFFRRSSKDNQGMRQDKLLQDCINQCQYFEVNDCAFPAAPEKINGLVLLGHVRHHLARGLGLRQAVDWMMFVDKELNDDAWKDGFEKLALDAGLAKLACALTCFCQDYLGLDGSITWCREGLSDDGLPQELLEDILAQGNFGRKRIGIRKKIETASTSTNGFIGWAKRLQHGGMTNWELAQTNKIASCFAWAYQIGHIATRLMSEGSLSGHIAARKEGKRRSQMLERLGL